MKLSKQRIKNIFILLIAVFVLVPIVLLLLNVDVSTPVYEGLSTTGTSSGRTTTSDISNSDYRKLSRVDISGVSIPYGSDLTSTYIGGAGEYIYCPAGAIQCPSGTWLADEVSYNLPGGNGFFSNTYNYQCVDVSSGSGDLSGTVTCDNYLSKDNINSVYLQEVGYKEKGGNAKNEYLREITHRTLPNSGLDGFTDPYAYAPLSISGDYVYLYKADGSLNFYANKCFLDSSCNPEEVSQTTGGSGDDDDDDTTSNCPSSDDIKCYANNGVEKGGALCCGQSGVTQSTKYNCPSNLPYCEGYKCGQTWGTCKATKSQ
jgi:hypothetical protein